MNGVSNSANLEAFVSGSDASVCCYLLSYSYLARYSSSMSTVKSPILDEIRPCGCGVYLLK